MLFNQTNNNGGDVNNAIDSPNPDREGRKRIVRISNDMLCELLDLPPGTQIEGFNVEKSWREHRPDLYVMVSHPDFSPVMESCPITVISPSWRRRCGPAEFVSWNTDLG